MDINQVVVIDGNSLMFRAYYATAYTGNLMQTSNGLYTNALYGFVNMLNKVLDVMHPTHILVAFDAGKQTFRHQQYADYKGTRKKMPEELAMQIPLIKEYLTMLKIKQLELLEYEADDIVGTTAKMASKEGYQVAVISGDKDLLQLVDQNITVFLTKKGITELEDYTTKNFQEKMGFEACQMTDYKALIGDNSDNLPGVRGIGPKTAVSLLQNYHDLENIIANIANLKGKTQESFIQDQEVAKKTKFLATIFTEIPFDFTINDLAIQKPNYSELRKFYEKVEFKSFLKKLEITKDEKNEPVVSKVTYHYHDIEGLLKQVKNEITLDLELDGDNYHKANVLGMSFQVDNDAYFFDKAELFDERIKELLAGECSKNTIDVKKTIVALHYLGLEVNNIDFDFLLGSYVLNPSYPSGDLKSVFDNFLNVDLNYLEEIYGKKSKYIIPEENLYGKYAMDLTNALVQVKPIMMRLLEEAELLKLLQEIEIPLAYVLAKMEITGFKISTARLQDIGLEFKARIEEDQKKIYELSGHEFNIGSPKQLGTVLFEELGLLKGKKTKTGYSTNVEVLESLKDIHPIIYPILEYRKYSKLVSTYVEGLSLEINPLDHKVHTIFKQYLTMTGRLSSVEPNIQNIPIRSEDGRIIRSAFIPSFEGGYLVSADYSQIELRILASLAKCPAMINDFNSSIDLHTSTAAKINGVTIEEVTKDMRRHAKAVNFGIVYGMSDWGLSETLHIAPWEAARFIDKYFQIYPEIKTYLNETTKKAEKLGYTETIFKRRRYIPELKSANKTLQKFGERTAMNAPIQGSAADIIKIAMINVQKVIEEKNLQCKMVAQVHDELIIDVPKDELEIVKTILKEVMEKAINLDVKMEVDVEVGQTWDLK